MDVLTGPERRRRWSVEEAFTMVRESFQPSVNPNQWFHWRKLYQDGRLAAVNAGEEVMLAR
jgi:transposase